MNQYDMALIAVIAVVAIVFSLVELDRWLDRRKVSRDARARNQARPWRLR
jgi:hypothetical protein